MWGKTSSRMVTRDGPRARYGSQAPGFFGMDENYGHLPYEKQQELLWELGQIEIGVGTLVATNERIGGSTDEKIRHRELCRTYSTTSGQLWIYG